MAKKQKSKYSRKKADQAAGRYKPSAEMKAAAAKPERYEDLIPRDYRGKSTDPTIFDPKQTQRYKGPKRGGGPFSRNFTG